MRATTTIASLDVDPTDWRERLRTDVPEVDLIVRRDQWEVYADGVEQADLDAAVKAHLPEADHDDAPQLTPRQMVRALAKVTGQKPRDIARAMREAREADRS